MYWAWKNIKKLYPNLEYIGLNHYRRYFSFDKKDILFDVINKPENEIKNYKLNIKRLSSLIRKGYTIVSRCMIYPFPEYLNYAAFLFSADFRTLRKLIHSICPEYDDSFFELMFRRNAHFGYNMFVMKWEDFDSYCTWLFKILFEAEKQIDISTYKGHHRRIYGYMAELLFNVWVINHNVKIKKFNVYAYRDDYKNRNRIKRVITIMRYNISFFIMRSWHKKCNNFEWITKEE